LIEKSRAVLLHFHYLVDARFFLSLRRRLPLPAIVSGYGWDVSVFPKKHMGLGSRYLRPIFTEMQMFLAMSEDMREDLLELGCPRSKIVVHYHGIDTKRFRFPDRPYMKRPEVRVLFCARLAPKKSPETLIEAINILERDRSGDFPDLHVTLVGNGPSRAKLEELVDQYGLRRKVTFKGHIRHEDQALVREYHDADVFVLPSRTAKDGDKEGIPGTLVEALSAGLPVISTRHAGIPSVVKDGINGLLVEEGDSRAIAERLLVLLTDAELRRRLGLEAARTAAELDLEKRTRVLESIYSEAVKTWASVRRSSM
jgi:colanic acid/amylovoran biosynthesis glycosyltransferase